MLYLAVPTLFPINPNEKVLIMKMLNRVDINICLNFKSPFILFTKYLVMPALTSMKINVSNSPPPERRKLYKKLISIGIVAIFNHVKDKIGKWASKNSNEQKKIENKMTGKLL